MEDWFVVIDGKPVGPYSFSDLKDISIKPGTFLRSAGMDDYKEAHEIPEIRELMGFKYRIVVPQYFATLDIRLLATAIDYLIVFSVYTLIDVVFISFAGTQFLKIIISAAGLVLIPAIKFIYSSMMEASPRQGTYGKYWLGIKVCDENGSPLSLVNALIRNLAKLLCVLTLGIGFLSGFFNKKQQCLHDIIAGTLVIKDRLI